MALSPQAMSQRPRILVTAPSNAAVDAILQRLVEKGFMDGTVHRYNPPIVRVGISSSPFIASCGVCLEPMVDDLLRMDPAYVAGQERTLQSHKLMFQNEVGVYAVETCSAPRGLPIQRCWAVM